jgi:CRISPR/Cas system CSM-associated protein Csm3 (group 7 of RAMP superfamily)
MSLAFRVCAAVRFPAGLRPGEGRAGNVLVVARDGQGRPVLRGTALAGALRHAWAESRGKRVHDEQVSRWFGTCAEDESGGPSPLRVADVVLTSGDPMPSVLRTHNARHRHTGSVLGGGLVDIESLPPGTRGTIVLTLVDDTDADDANAFLKELVVLLGAGMTLGGNAARGIGRVELSEAPLLRRFDLSRLDDHADWLDESVETRAGRFPTSGDAIRVETLVNGLLRITLELVVPRGQDLAVGDGQGLDHDIEPQRVLMPDGRPAWRLPGSTLRGALRAWVLRLAAREGLPVADSLDRHEVEPSVSGADLAYGFGNAAERERIQDTLASDPGQLEALVRCPVMRLFGSGYSKGRLHIADAFATCDDTEQVRRHVSVDRLTGGASEGFLFDCAVLTRARFTVEVTVRQPTEDEVRWLAASVRALDMGLIRIGSSSAAGRLALERPPRASGPYSDRLMELVPAEAWL